MSEPAIKLRTAQREFMRGLDRHRLAAFVARRQFGKTTTFAAIALRKMMKRREHTVIFGSSKLSLAREIVRKEAQILRKAVLALQAETSREVLHLVDGATGRTIDGLSEDDLAGIYEAQRLEFRYNHTRTSYSRTKVVALNPDTVGETGDLMCDEIGRVRNWRDVWEAVEPIVSSDPTFRLTLSTTPPPDDKHYSFEMLAPQTVEPFPVNAAGNWYRSEMGVHVLRVDACDAYADGVPVYDLDTGEPLAPEQHRARAMDKDAWDRNYGLKFIHGGTAACSLTALQFAQAAGAGKCAAIQIETDTDLHAARAALARLVGDGQIGLGYDIATTEGEKSNPSAVTVMEKAGLTYAARLIVRWKTADPARAREIVGALLETVAGRKVGGKARRLCIDATNERYFATELRKQLMGSVPVELVIASETIEKGGETLTMKAYLGNLVVNALEDGRLPLPPDRWVKDDFRLVVKDAGTFFNETDAAGNHADTFDSTKLSLHAVTSPFGPFAASRVAPQRDRVQVERSRKGVTA